MNFDQWVEEMTALCTPKSVRLCNGSEEEFSQIAQEMVQRGIFVPLQRPNSFWCHSSSEDVARVEESTFICTHTKEMAGPTNNWMDPLEMKKKLLPLFNGSMKGRVMYVIPYCMGPLDSPYSILGVEATDSPYVVLNMKLMTRMGLDALSKIRKENKFVPGLHSVGVPLRDGQKDEAWPCNPKHRTIAHFPEEKLIWSFGSGYGGNALLGKKCLALRIASWIGREEGWLAEHMLILGITHPSGEKRYIAASFPSACGKTNLAMLSPLLEGWKVETVGDDIAWMHLGEDGRLFAINPEAGYFGVAPGTSYKTNPNAMKTIEKNTIFTNVALTANRDVWWEQMSDKAPENLTSWEGVPWDPLGKKPASHPNARFTVSAKQNPIYDKAAEDPSGVPISAILFGGRRATTLPLVFEAFSWQHGVFLGASVSSETTAAAKGTIGKLRHDPFSMLPFCGYNIGDYFSHWLKIGKKSANLPKIFAVNWFRKDAGGNYLWPGFRDNIRVLEWIFDRCRGEGKAKESPIGYLPQGFNLQGLKVDEEALFQIDKKGWEKEAEEIERYFETLGTKVPVELFQEVSQLKSRLNPS